MANRKKSAAQSVPDPAQEHYDVLAHMRALIGAEPDNAPVEASPAFHEAARALDRIEVKHGLRIADRLKLRQALVTQMMFRVGEPEPPAEAPELWTERGGRKENPVSFIRRVYAPWLGKGLQRSDLHSLDRPLYAALAVWLHRYPETDFPELLSDTQRRTGAAQLK